MKNNSRSFVDCSSNLIEPIEDIPNEEDIYDHKSVADYNSESNDSVLVYNKGNVKNKSKFINNLMEIKQREIKSQYGSPCRENILHSQFKFPGQARMNLASSTRNILPLSFSQSRGHQLDRSIGDIYEVEEEKADADTPASVKKFVPVKRKKKVPNKSMRLKFIREAVDSKTSSFNILSNLSEIKSILKSDDDIENENKNEDEIKSSSFEKNE